MYWPNFEAIIETKSIIFDTTIDNFRCSGYFGQNILQNNYSILYDEQF